MSDIASELPVRSQLPGQVLPDDIIVKIGDGANPTTQFLAIDSAGRITTLMDDGAGNPITSQVNGAQRALDIGIDVGGVQIDPRQIRALTASDVVTANQGSAAATHSSPWWTRLTDGTNDSVLLATGELTVAVTQPLPAGSNNIGSVNQGTSPWIVKDQADGPVSPGTAASFSQLAGGVYNSAAPTLTNGQQSALQLDSSGRLMVVTTSTDDHNYGTVGANTLRTAAQIGNATGAADFNAGATGAQTLRVQANQGAASNAAGGWFVRPTDGTNSQAYTAAGEAKVDITEPLPAGTNVIGAVTQSGGPWTSNVTEIGGSALALGQTTMANSIPVTFASDQSALPVSQSGSWTVTALQGTSPWVVSGTVTLSEDMNWGTVGSNTLRTAAEIGNATGAADFNFGAVGAQTLRTAAELGNATGALDYNYGTIDAQALRVAAQIGNATGAADFNNGATSAQTLRVAANLAVAGANVSATNPVPVSLSAAPLGTPVNDYKVASAVAAGASDNHDYTITALKTFQGKLIWASASDLIKIEVQISPDGVAFTSKWVGFSSSATPNIAIELDEMLFLESGVGSKIRVIVTNEGKKAQDVYSTISGLEV